MNGWTDSDAKNEVKCYYSRRNEISLHQGCLLWGVRVIIPMKLRQTILQEIHVGHLGVVKMKSFARSYVWWPGIDADIEEMSKKCNGCQQSQNMPKAAPLHPWEWPSRPWQRVHVDFAGPFMGSMFFIMVDAHSKWPEVIPMNKTTSSKTIEVLRMIFARNGLPNQLVSDNGPHFTSEEFQQCVSQNGIKHITSAPYHPSTNGLAERFVQSFKHAMKSAKREEGSINKKLAEFLLAYRTAPHCTTNESPAQLFLQRNLTTRLDIVRPNIQRHVQNKQFDMIESRNARERQFNIGQSVAIRDYRSDNKWTSGLIHKQTGPVSYQLEVAPNVVWRRHTDQIVDSKLSVQHTPNTALSVPLENAQSETVMQQPTTSVSEKVQNTERRYPK